MRLLFCWARAASVCRMYRIILSWFSLDDFDTDPEYPGVEDDHDEAGDVEAAEGGVDDEVRVVEHADDGLLLLAQHGVSQGLVVSLGTGQKISQIFTSEACVLVLGLSCLVALYKVQRPSCLSQQHTARHHVDRTSSTFVMLKPRPISVFFVVWAFEDIFLSISSNLAQY